LANITIRRHLPIRVAGSTSAELHGVTPAG